MVKERVLGKAKETPRHLRARGFSVGSLFFLTPPALCLQLSDGLKRLS